jgi:hypothetical protein
MEGMPNVVWFSNNLLLHNTAVLLKRAWISQCCITVCFPLYTLYRDNSFHHLKEKPDDHFCFGIFLSYLRGKMITSPSNGNKLL